MQGKDRRKKENTERERIGRERKIVRNDILGKALNVKYLLNKHILLLKDILFRVALLSYRP